MGLPGSSAGSKRPRGERPEAVRDKFYADNFRRIFADA